MKISSLNQRRQNIGSDDNMEMDGCYAGSMIELMPVTIKQSISPPYSPTSSSSSSCSSRRSDAVSERAAAKPKHCIMCYKRANVLHYGVPACPTCKTFFRRSLMSERELHCKRKEECSKPPEYWSNPTIAQRIGQCSWCRLARFVSLGMNPCAVAPRNGKELLEYPNVAKLFEMTRNPTEYCAREMTQVPGTSGYLNSGLESVFWRIRRCDSKHRQLRTSEFNPRSHGKFNWRLSDYLRQPMEMEREIQEMIWARHDDVKAPSVLIKKEILDEEDSVPPEKCEKKRALPLLTLKKNWAFTDTVCAIEYVKYFFSSFALDLAMEDQVAVLQRTVIPLSLLEMTHFSWYAGFERLTFPDGTQKREEGAYPCEALLSKLASLSLTRSELAITKALIVCKADQISVEAREIFEELTVQLSKILTSLCLRKYGEVGGIARMTSIVDLFHALEVQKSTEIEQHVVEYLNKVEPRIIRDLYLGD